MKKKIICISICLILIITVIPVSSTIVEKSLLPTFIGNVLYVGGDGPGNYSRIQDAIDDAMDGDTVFVYDDNSPYYENVIVNKSISLIGEGKETTIIDGNNWRYVVYISADWVNISGFTIRNSGSDIYDVGIGINSNFTTITDNTISFNAYGLYLETAFGNAITYNNIRSNLKPGIYLSHSSANTTIMGNNIYRCSQGIYILYGNGNNAIFNNIISSNKGSGIYISRSENNIITNNLITNNTDGILLYFCTNNIISDNSFFNDGLNIYGAYQNTISNNKVNSKPIVFLKNESDKILSDSGQIILLNCDNITIKNQKLSNIGIGIDLEHTHNCLILDNTITSNTREGIRLDSSNNNNITGNTITLNAYEGIALIYSSNNIINDNAILNNGFRVWGMDGIFLYQDSNSNTISGNIISSNKDCGLRLETCSNNKITGNTISNNGYEGIKLRSSNSNNITDNKITSNKDFGIYIDYPSEYNIIYHNNFINIWNAFDSGTNIWDDGEYGNYWSDYKENYPDAKRKLAKGIWDTPYEIGGGNNNDTCPLIRQWSKPLSKTTVKNVNNLEIYNKKVKTKKFFDVDVNSGLLKVNILWSKKSINNHLLAFFDRFTNLFPILKMLLQLLE